MTLEELIAHVDKPKELAQFIATSAHPVRIWDNGVLDITLGDNESLADFIGSFKCPLCDKKVSMPSSATLDSDIKGISLKCPICGQKYFAHIMVKFGGTQKTTSA